MVKLKPLRAQNSSDGSSSRSIDQRKLLREHIFKIKEDRARKLEQTKKTEQPKSSSNGIPPNETKPNKVSCASSTALVEQKTHLAEVASSSQPSIRTVTTKTVPFAQNVREENV